MRSEGRFLRGGRKAWLLEAALEPSSLSPFPGVNKVPSHSLLSQLMRSYWSVVLFLLNLKPTIMSIYTTGAKQKLQIRVSPNPLPREPVCQRTSHSSGLVENLKQPGRLQLQFPRGAWHEIGSDVAPEPHGGDGWKRGLRGWASCLGWEKWPRVTNPPGGRGQSRGGLGPAGTTRRTSAHTSSLEAMEGPMTSVGDRPVGPARGSQGREGRGWQEDRKRFSWPR